jgi:hypothetical protein
MPTQPVFSGRRISIVIRLIQRHKFVVRAKNSIVPPSNEFVSQVIVIGFYFLTMDAPLTQENAIFAVLGAGGLPEQVGAARPSTRVPER